MAFVVADRVREFSTTSGTADFLLGGAAVGFQTFIAGIGNGNSTYYAVSLPGTTQWEVGIGTVSVGTLTRDTVLASSTGTKVDFAVGTKDIYCTAPADRSLYVFNGQIVAPASGVLPVGSGGTGVTTLGDLITALAVPTLAGANTFSGTNTFSTVDINGGAIDGTPVGSTTPSTGAFSSVDIDGGAIDGASVGATVPASGSFTSLSSNSTTTLNGTTIPASKTLVDTDSSQTLTNKALNGSVGATTPAAGTFTTLKATATVEVPTWTTATRPATGGGEGNFLGFNSDTAEFEGWNGVEWASVGGSKIEVDSTSAADLYPLFSDSITGTAKVVNVDNTSLTYNPSTKRLSSPVPVATNGVFIHEALVTQDLIIGAGERGISTYITIADGVDVTVDDDGIWTIV